ncbi:MAG: hypothetical protein AAB402_04935 [Patescibacteria group bacterium]
MKWLYRTSFVIAGIMVIATMLFGYFFNLTWYWFHQRGFNINWGYFLTTSFSIFGVFVLFGMTFAIFHRRRRPLTRHHFVSLSASIMAYFAVMAGFEVLWLEPWTVHTYTDNVGMNFTYNAYKLDAVYGTSMLVAMLLMILLSYLATMGIMAFWSRLRLGTHQQEHLKLSP